MKGSTPLHITCQTYLHWDVKSPTLPARSHFFRLEPIGIGTARVESLASYVSRLAVAHSVSSHTLLTKKVYASAPGKQPIHYRSIGGSSSQINGMGNIANTTATQLEQLTLYTGLRYMTMLTWGNILSPQALLRPEKRWCAICYEEWSREGRTLYEPLIWALEAVTICPWHHRRLCYLCPHCSKQLPTLARYSRPGYCLRCWKWLGLSTGTTKHNQDNELPVSAEEFARQVSIINVISELLSRAPDIVSPPPQQRFIANFAKCIEQTAKGNINSFSAHVGLWSGTVRRLLLGKTKLSLSILVQLCSLLNVSPFDLLSGTGNEEMLEKRNDMLVQDTLPPEEPVSWALVEGKLHAALQECPPPSFAAVARRMGYYQFQLTGDFPKVCARIVSRYKEYRKDKHPSHAKVLSVLHKALKEQPPPSLQKVLRSLGCQDTGYYYYHNYPDLAFAIARRFKAHRNKPFDVNDHYDQLQSALVEQPPPSFSEIARRLDHNREFVRKKFPELSKAIASRHIYYLKACRKEKAERLRTEIREAILHITGSGLYVSEARVREYVRKSLPRLGRDSLFKQALHEIKSEMGLIK